MKVARLFAVNLFMLTATLVFGQSTSSKNNQIRFNLSDDGKNYVRFTFLNQVWLRYTDANPGSTLYGYNQNQVFDIGLRRTRMQVFGKLSPHVFFYSQFGINNFNANSKQFSGAFFHDAVTEYHVNEKHLCIGAGLTGWTGLSRYASPSTLSILTLDVPLYQQTTNGVNDQFLRKLSLYAKGKIGKLDYRLALSKPMAIQNAVSAVQPLSINSDFSLQPAKLQSQAYFMYQFLDQEDNTTPYTTGTYLGKKKVFNIGAGIIYQPHAMWNLNGTGDTLYSDMLSLGFDIFYDTPINDEKGNAITAYVAFNNFNFGPNYVRNVGVMNPLNGVDSTGTFNGAGNAFPMIGSGNTIYGQLGYLFKKELLGKGTIQVYGASQVSIFDRLDDNMLMIEGGINWLIEGTHNSKISLNYQNRPVFSNQTDGSIRTTQRKGMIQLQYQIAI